MAIIEWVGFRSIRHARVSPTTPLSPPLCGIDWADAPLPKRSEVGLRCTRCMELAERLATPEGALVYAALQRLDVPPECWALAHHVVRINTKLAIDLAAAGARLEALYAPPQPLAKENKTS